LRNSESTLYVSNLIDVTDILHMCVFNEKDCYNIMLSAERTC